MPQGNDYFGDTKDALRMMIPVAINRNNIEANAIEQQKRLDFMRKQQEEETLRAFAKSKQEEEAAKKKLITDMFMKSLENQADPYVQSLGPQVEQMTGAQLPKYFESPTGQNKYSMFPPKPMTPYQEESIDLRRLMATESQAAREQARLDRLANQGEMGSYRQQMLDLARERNAETKNKNLRDEQGTKPPKGYRWNANQELEPIPGSKDDVKVREQYSADVAGIERVEDTLSRTTSTIDQILKNDNGLRWATGYTGYAPDWVSQDKKDATIKIDELKNKIFVQAVESMRQASANGSTGLGQLTEKEGDKIQNSFANLDRAQSYEQMKAALLEIKSVVEASRKRIANKFKTEWEGREPKPLGQKQQWKDQNLNLKTLSDEEILKQLEEAK